MSKAIGWAATGPTSPLGSFAFERRELAAADVAIDISFCGVCHSDIHTVRNEWPGTVYPCVPGHEIVGSVTAIGGDVTRFAVGDVVGVGCMVDSCGDCEACKQGLEQYCSNGTTWTYGSADDVLGGVTHGGYSDKIVVPEDFVVKVPDALDPAEAAPILCAGITAYSPLRHWGAGPGKKVGIAGFGGIGEIATKLAKAMGATVVVITRTESKADAARQAGADDVLITTNAESLRRHADSFDLIVSTVPKTHDVNPYLSLLKRDSALVIVGAIEPLQQPVDAKLLVSRRISLTGSNIGGIRQTQEVLDFCAEHGVVPKIEQIRMEQINNAFDRVSAGDLAHRYVIDMASVKAADSL